MNLHTLHVEHVYLLVVYTLLTIANSRLQKGMRGVRLFVLYSFLALAGATAVVLRGTIPNAVSIVLGDVFVLGGYAALYLSMARLFAFGRKQNALAAIWFAAGSLAMVWWGAVEPNTGSRLLAFSVALGVQQLHLAGLLLLGDAARRRLSWMLGVILIALASANCTRMATVLLQGAPEDYRRSGPALAAIVLANACLQCGVMVAYVWMTAAILRRRLELQANTDPLTGLLNRRALDEAAEREVRVCNAGEAVFSAILVDLDDYKPINDKLGHAAGDRALIAVARALRAELRTGDLLARSGGDEFMALLPRTEVEEALNIAERLRARLQVLDLGVADPNARVTGSFGVASAAAGDRWDDLYKNCDRALYAVKHRGGNAVFCYAALEEAGDRELLLATL
jgi:diguanylate cyclase (GGDEF)-like protein